MQKMEVGRGVVLLLAVATTGLALDPIPDNGEAMSWGEANARFAENSMMRDYGRVSAALDAADQSAGLRPNDKLTRGVPFSKVPNLHFTGFAQGKMDGGLDSYVRQMTPYLSSSHFINNMRKPLTDNFITPMPAPLEDPRTNEALEVGELNRMFSLNPDDHIKDEDVERDLERSTGQARAPTFGGMGGMPGGAPPMRFDLAALQTGNPYALASPFFQQPPQQPLLQQQPGFGTLPGGLSGGMGFPMFAQPGAF